MDVFVTGASGHIGSAVIPDLLSAGHRVLGLARSDTSAAALSGLGAEAHQGSLDDLDSLRRGAAHCDGVVHLAFRHDLMGAGDYQGALEADLNAINAMAEVLTGTGNPFVIAAGTIPLASAGRDALTEFDTLPSGARIDAENLVVGLAEHGVRSSVVRLPPVVHSDSDRTGFIPTLIARARQRDASGFLANGSNRWPAVHTLDAAHVFRLALESAPAGSRLHPVAEQGVPFRDIAESIGRHLAVPVTQIAPEDADEHFGFLAALAGVDNPVCSEHTRTLLTWSPNHQTLLEDLESGHYFHPAPAASTTPS